MASLSALLEAYKDSNRPCRDQLVRSVDQLANFLETAPTPLAPVERQLRRFDMSSFFNRFGLCRNIDALLAGLGFYEQPPGMDGVLYLPVSPAQTLSGASTWRNISTQIRQFALHLRSDSWLQRFNLTSPQASTTSSFFQNLAAAGGQGPLLPPAQPPAQQPVHSPAQQPAPVFVYDPKAAAAAPAVVPVDPNSKQAASSNSLVEQRGQWIFDFVQMGFPESLVRQVVMQCDSMQAATAILLSNSASPSVFSEAAPAPDSLLLVRESSVSRRERENNLSLQAIAELERQDREESAKRQRQNSIRDFQLTRDLIRAELESGVDLHFRDVNQIMCPTTHTEASRYACEVCGEDELTIDQLIFLDCGHFACVECMRTYLRTMIVDQGRSSNLKCSQPNCVDTSSSSSQVSTEPRNLRFSEVKRCLRGDPESVAAWEKYQDFLLEGSLRLDPNCRWCPRPGCGVPLIGDPSRPMMVCQSEKCRFAYCFNCKEPWHADVSCEAYQCWKRENNEGEKRYAAWAKQNTKLCPQCRVPIEKNGGCNHMTCGACKFNWCWLCNGSYQSGHFSQPGPCRGMQFS